MQSRIHNETPITFASAIRWLLLYLVMLVLTRALDLLVWLPMDSTAGTWLNLGTQSLGTALYFAWMIRRTGIRFRVFEGITLQAVLLALAGTVFCIVLISFGLSPILSRLIPQSEANYLEAFQPYLNAPVAGFLTICVISPIAEELLMRGFVLGGLQHRYGALRALLLSSVLFAVMHMNLLQGITAAAIGFVLGHLYVHTGSLFASILMHALYNAVSFVAMLMVN